MLFIAAGGARAAQGDSATALGQLENGASVKFVRPSGGTWGIEVSGGNAARFTQPQPVQIEFYQPSQPTRQLAAGYDSVKKVSGAVVGTSRINAGNGVVFSVTDHWSVAGKVLSLSRKLAVAGNQEGAGFFSAIRLRTDPGLTWPDVSFLAPGLLYGDPTYDGPASPGGTRSDAVRRFSIREDFLPAPLFGMSLKNGDSLTVLDAAPRGNTTTAESSGGAEVMIDPRFAFAGLGANQSSDGGIEIGYWLPGTTSEFSRGGFGGFGRRGGGAGASTNNPAAITQAPLVQTTNSPMQWRLRYNPVKDGFTQSYQVVFRFGTRESFPDLTRDAYRWAWQVLKPALNWQDIEVVRRSLIDQLSSQVFTIEGRTGLPFIVSTVTGQVWDRNQDPAFYWRATMGFVGKNIEAADQLLRESERDSTERGHKMRQQGLDIIATFIRTVPMNPPTCTGVNLKTGLPR
jgi:hypothetical protein